MTTLALQAFILRGSAVLIFLSMSHVELLSYSIYPQFKNFSHSLPKAQLAHNKNREASAHDNNAYKIRTRYSFFVAPESPTRFRAWIFNQRNSRYRVSPHGSAKQPEQKGVALPESELSGNSKVDLEERRGEWEPIG